jgi:D-threo-aldose 1-dehydrogenase
MDGAVPALARLKAEGAIAGFGLGVNDWQVCVDALAHADLDVLLVAGRYTLLDQTALPVLMPLCARRGTRVVAGGPFNSGILASGTRPADGRAPMFNYAPAAAEVLARAAAIEDLCAAHRVPLKAAALQFPRAHPAVACVLAGARSVAELDENLALAAFAIPAAFWRDLRGAGLVAPDAPLPGEDPP